MNLNSAVGELKGIGEKTEQMLNQMGVYTLRDILLHFPREYRKYEQAKTVDEVSAGEIAGVYVRVQKAPVMRSTPRMAVTILNIQESTRTMEFIWYRLPYIRKTLKPGSVYVLYGPVKEKNGKFLMEQPKIYTVAEYERIADTLQPIYPLTKGLSNHKITKLQQGALEYLCLLDDYIPDTLCKKHDFPAYEEAIREMHFPSDRETLIRARKRLAYMDFFEYIMMMQMAKECRTAAKNMFELSKCTLAQDVMRRLPYELTGAQKKTFATIQQEIQGEYVMQRLIQGDVGSGKTIVAFLAMLIVAENGYQSAMMAPTEVLARQHYDNFCKMCEDYQIDVPVILLTGSLTAKQKREAYEKMQTCTNAIVVGTHALIQEKAIYDSLALVITDEQHRFGVKQRETLGKKGEQPHILVMSATPIPRTLAMILYGDLDISVMDEMPAHRLPIKNCVVNTQYRQKAYEFIAKEVADGHQAYVICPLVEESENTDAENVIDYTAVLQSELQKLRIRYLHGKMKQDEKNAIMEAFLAKEFDVLVSTTVIEVGVDVKNTTVILIEDAQRFGLAQLHQLRGRVGRSDMQSYCIMIQTNDSKEARERLEIVNRSNDGFYIAKEDLRLRGQGDFLGVRQSGVMEFAVGDIFTDADWLQKAEEDVKEILRTDARLESPEHQALSQHMQEYGARWQSQLNL